MKKLLDFLVRLLFPPKCMVCKRIITEYDTICPECWAKVKKIQRPFCAKCSEPLEFKISDDDICLNCLKNEPLYIKSRTAFIYNKFISKIIMRFKFYDETYLKTFMAKNMIDASADIIAQIDILIPVPLHKNRLRQRKYNQSLLLCKEIAKRTGKIVITDFLYKSKHTIPQAKLNQISRKENLKNNFKINKKYKGLYKDKNFAIVDDVITTGTTINECVKILNRRGIKNVYAISFAKTSLNH
ncbi:MAG: ComF family protein [Rickettsiales bacterium]|nr:MAG: ComF family protein [Rickettsiales bacterium]